MYRSYSIAKRAALWRSGLATVIPAAAQRFSMYFHPAPSCWSSSFPAAGVTHAGVFDIRIDLARSRSEKPPQPTPHCELWSEVCHYGPAIGGPTYSYPVNASIFSVAAAHMIESGWKMSTFRPIAAFQKTSSSIIDESRCQSSM